MKTLMVPAKVLGPYTLGLFALGLFTSLPAQAQQNSAGANANRFGIAVVDVPYIFKNYQAFDAKMKALKTEKETADTSLKGERDAIQAKEAEKGQFNAGTPEFRQADEDIARMKAEFTLKLQRAQKDIIEKEAKVYYQTYLEVNNAVSYFAQQNNIGLVFRFNGEQVDPNRREDVLRGINKPVVFQNNVDITPDILALLNRRVANQPGSGQTR
ncbi:MAG: OmpH family outer membrane protein [Planctomycetota bacterium]